MRWPWRPEKRMVKSSRHHEYVRTPTYLYNLSLEELILGALDAGVRGALEAHEPDYPQRRLLHADHLLDHLSRQVDGQQKAVDIT